MFKPGLPELIVIFVVIILLFGAKSIPEIARGIANAWRFFSPPRAGWAFAAAALLLAFASHLIYIEHGRKAIPLALLLSEHALSTRKSSDIGRAILHAAPYAAAGQAENGL